MTASDLDDVALRARLDELHPIINAAGAPREAVLEYQALEDELYRRVDRDDTLVIACGWDLDPADEEDDSRHLDEGQGAPSEWGA
ncbi:hypothetical protein [Oerskovia paurometabola]|uniref:Uncharacterized protein n=1 Tax=Oerskovia paurometabola TaxID=162170 RepID=A0ABW1XBL6_9CELL|nr:hypothetical protein [Oerskovia paurometabola]MBM7497772.1 hypothetical protein [Oerskovia paurometabola]